MNYCLKFKEPELFAVNLKDAIACAVALTYMNVNITIWQGSKIVWGWKQQ